MRAEAIALAAATALTGAAALPAAPRPPGFPPAAGVERFEYLSPVPGSERVSPWNNIVLRPGVRLDPATVHSGWLQVTGSISGFHAGSLTLSDDRKTMVFRPDMPFALGEAVSIQLEPGVRDLYGEAISPLSFGFAISTSDPKQQPLLIPEEFPWLRRATPTDPRITDVPPDPGAPNSTPCDSVPSGYPKPVVLAANAPEPGAVFMAPFQAGNGDERLLITDNAGAPIFYRRVPGAGPAFDFKRQPDGRLTYFVVPTARFFVLDSAYTVVDSFATGNGYATDLHELQLLPNGHALLMSYDVEVVDMSQYVSGGNPSCNVVGLILQELDLSKNVVFQWRSWDHFAFADVVDPGYPLTGPSLDYVHGNAIELDNDGNLLLSSRHMNEITKIDRQTGNILWRLGLNAVNNEFTFLNDSRGFSHQHDIRRLPNGHITLFDNGNYLNPTYSRAVEYSLDESGKVAVQVWEHRNAPDIYGAFMGNTERQADGSTFIGWGGTFSNPKATEVHADGSTAFELGFQDAAHLLSYRAFRYTWRTNRFVTSADTLDFGGVGIGTRPGLTVTVRNNSNAEVRINCVQSTNPAFAASGPVPTTLEPGDTVCYQVTFWALNEVDQTGTLYIRQIGDNELIARCVALHGQGSHVLAVDPGRSEPPLVASRPNPFRGAARIGLTLPFPGRGRLDILDVHGRIVATLLDEVRPAGPLETEWRPGDRPDGVYFARLRIGDRVRTQKLVLMK